MKQQQRPHAVVPRDGRLLVGALAREELARRHYWIAEMTAREGLPVDWHFVAVRMAQALAGLPEATLGEGDVLWPEGDEA